MEILQKNQKEMLGTKNINRSWALVTHAYNPSYLGG
jgi:hypothetical protein